MKRTGGGSRLALMVLVAMLVLPVVEAGSPVEAKGRTRMVTRAFRNPATLAVGLADSSPVAAGRYPSTIAVAGMKGTIRDVNLRLIDLDHDQPTEVQLLLAGPQGQTATVMTFAGSQSPVSGVTLRLDDEAATPLPFDNGIQIQSGAYRPLNPGGNVDFNDPAPPAGANAALAVFDGIDPNGTWSLFMQDGFASAHAGGFTGGWELEITTKVKAKKKKR